jgi:hypothetical protein
MRLDPETRRRSILPLLAGALAALYLFVFVPLDRRAASFDAPLEKSWRQLAVALGKTNAVHLDFVSLTNQINETRAARAALDTAKQAAIARVELDEALRAKLKATFLLVDYENEAGLQMGALARLARQQGVALEPAVLAGFPELTASVTEPALLWAELAFLDALLTTAINSKVTTIHSVAAPLPSTHPTTPDHGRALAELPLNIELTGPYENVARFLQALPLRAAEINAAGLPKSPENKPPLFIDRMALRKQSPDKPDEVRLALRVVGFVFQNGAKR